jgi:hypothetical protein
MTPFLALNLRGSDVGTLALWFVGCLLIVLIVYGIMRYMDAPPLAYKIAAVIGLVFLLLLVIAFFFGSGPLPVGPVR